MIDVTRMVAASKERLKTTSLKSFPPTITDVTTEASTPASVKNKTKTLSASGPDPFSQNLTPSAQTESDPGWFCTIYE